MSELVLNEEADNGFQDGFLNGATFLYVCIQEDRTKYKSEETEYSVKCVVDEDTADKFADMFPKNKVNKVKTSEFEGTYKVAAPIPDAKNQYIITMKIDAERDGVKHAYDSFKRPKVYVPAGEGVKDITMETLVANGSKGDVSFWISSSEFGSFPKLQAIMVRELIVYEKREGSGSAWGAVQGAPKVTTPFETQAKEDAPAAIPEDEF